MKGTKTQARCYPIRFTIHASKYLISNHKQKEVMAGAARVEHQQKATEIKINVNQIFSPFHIQPHSIPAP